MVGLGGIFAEMLQDVAVQVAPVSEDEAVAMLRGLKVFPLLDGARGAAEGRRAGRGPRGRAAVALRRASTRRRGGDRHEPAAGQAGRAREPWRWMR